MAQSRYFINFPTITYNSTQAVDITERVVFLNNALKNPYLFYPYDISDDERPDQFANRYYSDSFKSWILYLSNQFTDPYYEWYMPQDILGDFINTKYQSASANCTTPGYQLAQQKIKYYQNNWFQSENISVSDFDALPGTLIKYWEPVYGYNSSIIAYQRKQDDQTIVTNAIVSYFVANTGFINDEICNIVFDNNNVGQGQVVSVANNILYIQHTSGTTLANISNNISYIYGQESQTNTYFYSANSVANNLLIEEQIYWTPVYYFDYENAKNESTKSIKVLDSAYSANIANTLKNLLK